MQKSVGLIWASHTWVKKSQSVELVLDESKATFKKWKSWV